MPLISEIYFSLSADSPEGLRPPLLFIHGAGGTHLFWPPGLRRLPGYRVYAIDLPGHGKSGGRGLQSIEAYAVAVRDWMEAGGLHTAVVVGHSMGSAIALALAYLYPEQVVGLGLIGSAARLYVAPDLLANAAHQATLQNAVDLIVARSFGSTASSAFISLASRRFAETRASVLYGDLLACTTFDLTAHLAQITAPALVLVGAEDRMTPVRHSTLLAGSLPNATLHVIPNTGHMLMLERPRELAALLTGFLSKIPFY